MPLIPDPLEQLFPKARVNPRVPFLSGLATALVLSICQSSPAAENNSSDIEWRYYGGNIEFNRYSPLELINSGNVRGLKVLWRRPAVDASITQANPDIAPDHYFRSTPIMIGGVLYAPDGIGLVEAFDATTGKTIWTQKPSSNALKELSAESTRGVAFWSKGSDERIVSIRGEYLYELHARDGTPCSDFGNHGRVSLHRKNPQESPFSISGGPLVLGDVIVVGGSGGGERSNDYGDQKKGTPESIRAYDVLTGKLIWEFSPLPKEGDAARETWRGDSATLAGAMGAYGTLSADPDLGYVYVPFSAPNPPVWGGWRPGDNKYGDSLVALEVKTGKKVWDFQMIHHDLWDWDLSAPPVLGDITVDGKRIRAVMQTGKNALLYTLDRVTGKPVWPIVERPVPQSTAPGEHSSPTQPIPTKPPALDRMGISEDDLIDFTPELHAKAIAILHQFNFGPAYMPPSLYQPQGGKKGTLSLPGSDGGGNWNTGAFDPETGVYYALTVTTPIAIGLVKPKAPDADVDYVFTDAMGWVVEGPDGLPLLKPPYGRVTAVDMNRGEVNWVVANGDGPRNHPLLKSLHLPALGIPGRAAMVVTKELIFVGESSDAVYVATETHGFGNKFRAYDKKTGAVRAEIDLGAGTSSAPMTYSHAGKQFVVVAIAGKRHEPEWVALGL